MHNFTQYVNPFLGKLLEMVQMDKVYTRGEGHYLFDHLGNKYLDFIAAYGALPFGFNPPEIWKALEDIRDNAQPSLIQPSSLQAAGELAEKLVKLAPGNLSYVTFTNSGAEAVEAAIKMARSATGRLGILSTYNSFHGKTMGALSATGKKYYQNPFGLPIPGFKHIPFGDLDALSAELENNSTFYAALIIEPIQGEGGIIVPPPGYLFEARELCAKFGVLFIADEIQTGLGRTGNLFACEKEKISPDIILLAKALGGGLFPIGACICSEEAYTKDFGDRHSSTFAANTLGCRIGLKVLDILTRNDQELVKKVALNGEYLKQELIKLQSLYSIVLKDVRGRGYMLGIELEMSRNDFPDCFLAVLSEQESLTPLVSSYLLNVENLRVAPTLNGNKVIRLEPSLTVEKDECQIALDALKNVLNLLAEGNTAAVMGPVLGNNQRKYFSTPKENPGSHPWNLSLPSEDPREGRFAFLIHPLELENYQQFDSSLSELSKDNLKKLAELGTEILDPFVIGRTLVSSKTGDKAYGEFITLPYTAKEMLELSPEEALNLLDKAMALAIKGGAKLVGLGAYTSVISKSGTTLQGRFLPVTTGNSYTVVAGIDAVKLAAKKLEINLASSCVAVIGATGSIGRSLAILLSEELNKIILIGSSRHPKASTRRLRLVAIDICRHLSKEPDFGEKYPNSGIARFLSKQQLPEETAPEADWLPFIDALEANNLLVITTKISDGLPQAQVILTATNSLDDLIEPAQLQSGAIICDISRPANVRPSLCQIRPDVLVIDGGIVAVPGRPSLGWDFGFETGLSYACMAETMMLALEHHYTDMSIGANLSLDNMLYLRKLAEKHGFELAQLRSFDKPISSEDWKKVTGSR
ncbi:MAG: aminotransferase class III-fold pyridoxal phosphate-dependent enzyme [Peptococcaceae bacterium]|nr:aminotransferase class III-fold pyridoxal phosphate-dependent enzyme [Peptococcaceae bacterium]